MNNRFLGILGLATVCTLASLPLAYAQSTDSPRGFRMHERADGTGIAAPRDGRRPAAGIARMRRPGFPGLARLDTDRDGQISEEEFLAPQLTNIDRLFERLDSDGDGLISRDESSSQARPRGQGRPDRPELDEAALRACLADTDDAVEPPLGRGLENRFDSADTNGDGYLSLDEISTALGTAAQQRFDRLDSDGDGYVSRAELAARAEAQRERARQVRSCLREQA